MTSPVPVAPTTVAAEDVEITQPVITLNRARYTKEQLLGWRSKAYCKVIPPGIPPAIIRGAVREDDLAGETQLHKPQPRTRAAASDRRRPQPGEKIQEERRRPEREPRPRDDRPRGSEDRLGRSDRSATGDRLPAWATNDDDPTHKWSWNNGSKDDGLRDSASAVAAVAPSKVRVEVALVETAAERKVVASASVATGRLDINNVDSVFAQLDSVLPAEDEDAPVGTSRMLGRFVVPQDDQDEAGGSALLRMMSAGREPDDNDSAHVGSKPMVAAKRSGGDEQSQSVAALGNDVARVSPSSGAPVLSAATPTLAALAASSQPQAAPTAGQRVSVQQLFGMFQNNSDRLPPMPTMRPGAAPPPLPPTGASFGRGAPGGHAPPGGMPGFPAGFPGAPMPLFPPGMLPPGMPPMPHLPPGAVPPQMMFPPGMPFPPPGQGPEALARWFSSFPPGVMPPMPPLPQASVSLHELERGASAGRK